MLNPLQKLNPKIFDKDVELIAIRKGFGEGLVIAGEMNKNIVGLCSDLTESTNMHLFTHELKLKKYENTGEIIRDYYFVRLEAYNKRKQYLLNDMLNELKIMTNKARYITDILNDKIDGTPEKLSSIQASLNIIMHKLGLQ